MHRLILISVLTFWAIMFGCLAHLSLSGLISNSVQTASELQLLIASAGQFQIMPVLLMVVATLFFWAILALVVSDDIEAYREIEVHSYSAAIFVMGACTVLAVANLGLAAVLPAVLVAALTSCVAMSQRLSIVKAIEPEIGAGVTFARHMALSAAHNSLLSNVSGRPMPGQKRSLRLISTLPTNPTNGSNS